MHRKGPSDAVGIRNRTLFRSSLAALVLMTWACVGERTRLLHPTQTPETGAEVGPPIVPNAGPEVSPPVHPDALTDSSSPAAPDASLPPDGRPFHRDTAPPTQGCTAGAACTANCTATCQVDAGFVGSKACSCTKGTLTCADCLALPLIISPDPCPDNASGQPCALAGLSCVLFGDDFVVGACECGDFDGSGLLGWICQ